MSGPAADPIGFICRAHLDSGPLSTPSPPQPPTCCWDQCRSGISGPHRQPEGLCENTPQVTCPLCSQPFEVPHLMPSECQSQLSVARSPPRSGPLSPTRSLSTLISLTVFRATKPVPTSASLACFPLCLESSSPDTCVAHFPTRPPPWSMFVRVSLSPCERGRLLGRGLHCCRHCGVPEGSWQGGGVTRW